MAFLNFDDINGRVRLRVKPLDIEEARTVVDDEFRGLMNEYAWSFARQNLVLTTIAPKTDGTIAVVAGGATVTGTGTSFADPGDVGKFIRLPDSNFYEVSAVTAQVLTLTAPFTGTTVSGVSYTLFQHRYALPVGIERILTMAGAYPVREGTQWNLDAVDPQRLVTGQQWGYMPIGENSLGQSMIELSPVPDAVYHLTYVGLIAGSITSGDQILTLLAQVLLEKAIANGCLTVAGNGNVQEGPYWMRLAAEWEKKQIDRMPRVRRADRYRFGYAERKPGDFYDAWGTDTHYGFPAFEY